jgi:HK97 family phage portal protein
MGLLTSLFRRSLENPSTPLSAPDDWLFDSLGSFRASSGVNVNRETALTYAPYWRCTSLLSGDVAKLPLCVYRTSERGKEHAKDHPAYRLLRYQTSPELMALQFKRVLTLHAIAEGNGYAYIQRDGAGRPLELWPLSPMKTYPVRENQRLWYVTEVGARQRKIRSEDMFHLKGLSFGGLVGYSVVAKMRESIGLALAFDNFGSIFFRNNARPNVVLKHPGRLKPEARLNLRESWERMHSGLENAHRTAILEEGLDLTVLQHNARDQRQRREDADRHRGDQQHQYDHHRDRHQLLDRLRHPRCRGNDRRGRNDDHRDEHAFPVAVRRR